MFKRQEKVQCDRNTVEVTGRGRWKEDGGGRLCQAWQVKLELGAELYSKYIKKLERACSGYCVEPADRGCR